MTATAAELLISLVSTIAVPEIIATTLTGPVAHCAIVSCDSQAAAPVRLSAAPRQIAPPYIRIRPQLT